MTGLGEEAGHRQDRSVYPCQKLYTYLPFRHAYQKATSKVYALCVPSIFLLKKPIHSGIRPISSSAGCRRGQPMLGREIITLGGLPPGAPYYVDTTATILEFITSINPCRTADLITWLATRWEGA